MTIQANFPAIKPSLLLDFANTKQLDSRITYTRASTASFYNGVTTAMAEQNLVLQSQTFDNASWTKSGATVTADSIAAPDGTTTGDTVTDTATSANHRIVQAVNITNSTTYTFSVFLKKGTNNFAQVSFREASDVQRYLSVICNLDTGAITQTNAGSSATLTSSSITSVNNGWYRVTVTGSISVGTNFQTYIALSDSATPTVDAIGLITYLGTGTNIYAWGAQIEQRSAVTAYTATTTQAITNYIPVLQTAASGVARFDNNPTTGESLGLLIEESKTNLFTYSEQFDNAAWTKQASTVTANAIVSPDGALDGEKLDETTANDTHRLEQNVTTVNGTVYTLSVFAKAAERQWVYLFEDSATNACTFNLSTGAVGTTQGSVTASISSVGNGWYRCSLTYTQSGTTGRMRIAVANGTSTTSYTGVANNGIFIWGAQTEAGAFATSYIPTVASQVTRAADAASMTGTNFSTWYNNGEGMFYSEGQLNYNPIGGGGAEWFSASDGTQSNKIAPYFSSGSGILFSNVVTSGVEQANTGATVISANVNFKYASVYKVNDFASVVNSGTASTDASGVVPYRLSQLVIGDGSSVGNRSRYYKKLAFYPQRLTNAQLQALTS